jgi:hypothetical protein
MPQYNGVWTIEAAAQAQSNQQWVTDPNFRNTTLLIQADNAANGAQNNTFVDSSPNSFAITRAGNTTQGTFTPFSQSAGRWSNYFTGSATSLRMAANAAFDQNAGSFSVECWVYPSTIAAGGLYIYGPQGNDQLLMLAYGYTTGLFKIDQGGGGGGIRITSSNTYAANTWHHVAYTYDGTTLKLFVNGNLQGTATGLSTIASPAVAIGEFGSSSYFNGYVSNFRICRAAIPTAYQTASTTVGAQIFTPTTTPLTTTSQGASNVSFLTCQSNRFIDNSTTPKAITTNGTPSVQPFSPFAPQFQWTPAVIGGSGFFDGTGDQVTAPNNAAFVFGSGDFTVETWVYATGTVGSLVNYSNGVSTNANWAWDLYQTSATGIQISLFQGSTQYIASSTSFSQNAWNHVAAVRNGNTMTIYVNGIAGGTTANVTGITANDPGGSIVRVSGYSNATNMITGYLSNLRIVKGTAVYTTAFTPPTAPLTAVSNTSLLLNFTNAGIYDGTMNNVLETVGNAQVSTSVVKYGSGSMYFDGTGDNLFAPFSQNLQLGTGDFTIEFWINASASGTYNQVVGTLVNGTEAGTWRVGNRYNSTNTVFFARGSGGGFEEAQYTVNVNDGAWHHVACVRLAGVIYMYVDGVARALTAGSASISGTCSSSNAFYVGYNGRDNSYITGYLDDVRITRGVARYTANFIPPQVALPRQ